MRLIGIIGNPRFTSALQPQAATHLAGIARAHKEAEIKRDRWDTCTYSLYIDHDQGFLGSILRLTLAMLHEIEMLYSNFGKDMYTPFCGVIIYGCVRGIQKLIAARQNKVGVNPSPEVSSTHAPNLPTRLMSRMAYRLDVTRQESLKVLKRAKIVGRKQAEMEMIATLSRFTHLCDEPEIQEILILDAQQEEQDERAYTKRTGLL